MGRLRADPRHRQLIPAARSGGSRRGPPPPAPPPPRAASHVRRRTPKTNPNGSWIWYELLTTDDAAALDFYGKVFGWEKNGAMPTPWGDYSFLQAKGGEEVWRAMMPREKAEHPVGWNVYFRVPDIEAAYAKVKELGGNPVMEPMAVPGGERIFFATDPQGAGFGLVAPK